MDPLKIPDLVMFKHIFPMMDYNDITTFCSVSRNYRILKSCFFNTMGITPNSPPEIIIESLIKKYSIITITANSKFVSFQYRFGIQYAREIVFRKITWFYDITKLDLRILREGVCCLVKSGTLEEINSLKQMKYSNNLFREICASGRMDIIRYKLNERIARFPKIDKTFVFITLHYYKYYDLSKEYSLHTGFLGDFSENLTSEMISHYGKEEIYLVCCTNSYISFLNHINPDAKTRREGFDLAFKHKWGQLVKYFYDKYHFFRNKGLYLEILVNDLEFYTEVIGKNVHAEDFHYAFSHGNIKFVEHYLQEMILKEEIQRAFVAACRKDNPICIYHFYYTIIEYLDPNILFMYQSLEMLKCFLSYGHKINIDNFKSACKLEIPLKEEFFDYMVGICKNYGYFKGAILIAIGKDINGNRGVNGGIFVKYFRSRGFIA